MTHSRRHVQFVLVMLVLSPSLIFTPRMLAQTASGVISGVVQDESGAVIPGVNVTVSNVDTGIGSSLRTDASGRYHVPSLIPGHYEVQAQISGFETGLRRGLQVTVGSELEINMVLKVGQVTEKTVVTAEAPMVETSSSSLSGLVDDKTIRDLPLNGRSFDQLISLQSSAPTFRAYKSGLQTGSSAEYSVNGSRTYSNMYLIDGTEMVSANIENTMPGGAVGVNMGVDAVQEFSVLSSHYSAAYGKKAGGVINIATRSGTNQIHGSAFDFFRNSHLDARNFFDPTPQPPPFKRNNFGGAVGGPIRKDSSFFFGNYEGLRSSLGLSNIATVPDASAHLGLLPGANGQLTNVGVNPAVAPFLAAYYPLPNGRTFGDGTAEYIASPQQPTHQDFFLIRFDQKLSDKDTFFARYNFSQGDQTTPGPIPLFSDFAGSRDQILTLEEKRAYATTVNLLRFGFSRGNLLVNSAATPPMDKSLRFFPSASDVGQVTIAASGQGGRTGGAIARGGPNNFNNRGFVVNQFEVADQVFRYSGPHSLQFGVQVQRIQHNDRLTATQSRGTFAFASLMNFLQGTAVQYQGPPLVGSADPSKSYRQIYFAPFIQDDYKLLRNFTLNLGLHYEITTVPVEASGNRISNYHYQVVNGFQVLDSLPTLGNPFFQAHHTTFAPRIGFAWDPFSDGKLAVRGGFGIFYDQVDSSWRHFTPNNPPFGSVLTVNSPPFPQAFAGGGTTNTPLPTPEAIDSNLQVPTRLQYSFGIQRQVTSSSVFDLGYVGSHSYHLAGRIEGNTAAPQILPGGVFFYPAGSPRLNPALASNTFILTQADAFYNSLQLNFIQRVSHGVRFKVSYTLAKSMDDASHTVTATAGGGSQGYENPFDRRADRGLSAYNVRNSMATNFTYDVPWSHVSGFTGRLMGGWQVGGIITLQSGTPFTALTGVNRSRDLSTVNLGDRPNLKSGASHNPVLGGPDKYFDPSAFEFEPLGFYGNLGRNTLIGPGFANMDFTLVKMTTVNERLKVDFRAEFFNLLNRANFYLPNNTIFNTSGQILGAAGRIQSTASTSRQIQFGLKLIF